MKHRLIQRIIIHCPATKVGQVVNSEIYDNFIDKCPKLEDVTFGDGVTAFLGANILNINMSSLKDVYVLSGAFTFYDNPNITCNAHVKKNFDVSKIRAAIPNANIISDL